MVRFKVVRKNEWLSGEGCVPSHPGFQLVSCDVSAEVVKEHLIGWFKKQFQAWWQSENGASTLGSNDGGVRLARFPAKVFVEGCGRSGCLLTFEVCVWLNGALTMSPPCRRFLSVASAMAQLHRRQLMFALALAAR